MQRLFDTEQIEGSMIEGCLRDAYEELYLLGYNAV
jgi:hypothetical protein